MSSAQHPEPRLVADVGGSHTRIALYDPALANLENGSLRALHCYDNRDFPDLEAVIADWHGRLEEAPPESACIAVAAPLAGDRVRMTNVAWTFSRHQLARRFGWRRVSWINDFVSNAYALLHLAPGSCETLQIGEPRAGVPRANVPRANAPRANAPRAVIGPGTGLGGATLGGGPGAYRACAGEPGQMGLSPADEEELALFALLLPAHGEVYAELLVSGPGLLRLYHALAQLRDQPPVARSPAEISALALSGADPLCRAALLRFCSLLGSVCGDFVLATGSYGGLYLAGGIVPRILPLLRSSDFLARFSTKGAMGPQLSTVPVFAITAAQPGLLGAAHAPLEGARETG